MPAPTLNAGNYEAVDGGDGFDYTHPNRWAGISPFSVSIAGVSGSPQYQIRDPEGAWGLWSAATRSVAGTLLTSAILIPDIANQTANTLVMSDPVDISEEGHQFRMRVTTGPDEGDARDVTWTIGGQTDIWTATVTPPAWNAGEPFEPTPLQGTIWYIDAGNAVANLYCGVGTDDPSTGTIYRDVQPGDTIVLRGGARRRLKIRDCTGTALAPVLITNEPGAAQVVVRSHASAGTGNYVVELWSPQYVIVDGLQEYTGATPGQVNFGMVADTNDTFTGDRSTGMWKLTGLYTHVLTRGVDVDGGQGNGFNGQGGNGFQVHDNAVLAASNPGFYYEDIIFEFCRARNCGGEGFYMGGNRGTGQDPIPLLNPIIRYCETEYTGKEGINVKHSLGLVDVHHNTVRHTGREAVWDSSQHGQKNGINAQLGYADIDIHDNKVYDAGVTGVMISYRRKEVGEAQGSFPSTVTGRMWNNEIIRTGLQWSANYDNGSPAPEKAHGIDAESNDLSWRTVNILVANNTVVDPLFVGLNIGQQLESANYRDNLCINAPTFTATHSTSSAGAVLAGNLDETDASAGVTDYDDTLDGDYTLLTGSPAKNTASNSAFPTDDIDGNARPFGGTSDVGAHERQSA